MIRSFRLAVGLAALSTFSFGSAFALAQQSATPAQEVPPAPAHAPASPEPNAPAAPAAPAFPKPDPNNFTAASPTQDEVNQFLQTSWGYDDRRNWQVQAIMKTPAEGVSKVVVFVGDKSGKEKPFALQFFTVPDGKHIIAGNDVVPFGAHPYAEAKAALEAQADGPFHGAAEKSLELVEFADFQCPHCKDAQANMEKLGTDFPHARIVFQNYPLARIHPEALRAAEYGVCVTKLGGSGAFFQFASSVFDGQEGLASQDGATLTLNSAVAKAGVDAGKLATCVADPATAAKVDASVKLAQSLNINETPTLMVNGRQVPIGGIDYDTLKKIIQYQASLDGVSAN